MCLPKVPSQSCCCAAQEASSTELASQAVSSPEHGQDERFSGVHHSWCECAKSTCMLCSKALLKLLICTKCQPESIGVESPVLAHMAQQGLDVEVLARSVEGALPAQWP
jgi:hypothetical protein